MSSVEAAVSPFEVIREASLKVMVTYQSDLEIDRAEIEKNEGVPFLHFTRASGTYMVMLLPYDRLPGKGLRVPYLFSDADRNHVINQIEKMSGYYHSRNEGRMGECLVTQYFDGVKVKKIGADRAAQIGIDHAASLRKKISKEKY